MTVGLCSRLSRPNQMVFWILQTPTNSINKVSALTSEHVIVSSVQASNSYQWWLRRFLTTWRPTFRRLSMITRWNRKLGYHIRACCPKYGEIRNHASIREWRLRDIPNKTLYNLFNALGQYREDKCLISKTLKLSLGFASELGEFARVWYRECTPSTLYIILTPEYMIN